jgi:hypothetical protein
MGDDEDVDPKTVALVERRRAAEERLALLHAEVVRALEEIDYALGIIERTRASLKKNARLLRPPREH